jgi:hypothetical protein
LADLPAAPISPVPLVAVRTATPADSSVAAVAGASAGTQAAAVAGRWRRTMARPRARWAVRVATGLAAAALVAGGLAVLSEQSGPNSPLWPITKVVHPGKANARLAEGTIRSAQEAAAAGRYDEARRLLDRAAIQAGRIDDPRVARRLLSLIEELRRGLPAPATGGGAAPVADPSASGVPASPGAGPGGSGEQGGPGGSGGQQGGGGSTGGPAGGSTSGPLPGLPINPPPIPVPSIPVPIPTVPVPSLPVPVPTLPGVPLPTLPTLPVPLPLPTGPLGLG